MSNALFVDASNLNVLFKVNGKFCLGASYLSCPERLVLDAQALGASFDVYISMWPRVKGEGDLTIRGLSLGGVPFVVLQEELKVLLDYIEKIPRVSDIYLCNALANYAIPSRVSNFQSLLCCGSRYALLEVRDKMLFSLQMFNSQREFYDTMGEEFSCYGDVDILDIDSLRAQYPELSPFKRNILVPLAHLITSYRSAYKMPIAEVRALLDVPTQQEEEEEEQPVQETVEETEPEVEEEEFEERSVPVVKQQKKGIDWAAFGLSSVACIAMLVTGIGYSLRDVDSIVAQYNDKENTYSSRTEVYNRIQKVYDSSMSIASKAAVAIDYAKSSDAPVNILSFRASDDSLTITFSATSTEAKDQYVGYIGAKYILGDTLIYTSSNNSDGTVVTQYGVVIAI